MKNVYKSKGDLTVVLAKTRTGYVPFKISTKHLEKMKALGGTWHLFPKGDKTYVRAKGTVDGSQPLLHRFITGAEGRTAVAFRDGNTLNCLEDNLVVLQPGETIEDMQATFEIPEPIGDADVAIESGMPYTPTESAGLAPKILPDQQHLPRNRQKALPPFPGPYPKGLNWHSTKKRWEVKVTWEGKRYHVGRFAPDKYDKAVQALEEFKKNGPKPKEDVTNAR